MTPNESEIALTPSEVQRRWELSYDHPESWVQTNATYRQIYARGRERGLEEAAKIADEHGLQTEIECSVFRKRKNSHEWTGHVKAREIANAIRRLTQKEG